MSNKKVFYITKKRKIGGKNLENIKMEFNFILRLGGNISFFFLGGGTD